MATTRASTQTERYWAATLTAARAATTLQYSTVWSVTRGILWPPALLLGHARRLMEKPRWTAAYARERLAALIVTSRAVMQTLTAILAAVRIASGALKSTKE